MPLIGLFVLFNADISIIYIPKEVRMSIYLTIFLSTIAIPLLLIPFLKYFKLITNIQMNERRERVIPLLIISLLYFFTFYWFKHFTFSPIIQSFMLSVTIVAIILFAVSIFWKISLHMTGIGGVSGLMLILSFQFGKAFLYPLLLVFFIAGCLGTARLVLDCHKPSQLYSGFFLGLIVILLFTHF